MSMKDWNDLARTTDAERLQALVEDKALECVKLARLQLGSNASDQEIEDLAGRLLEDLDHLVLA